MDGLEAIALADDLRSAYPGRVISDKTVDAWARELERMSAYEARKVVGVLSSRSTDPPSRAQVLQALAEVRQRTMSPKFDSWSCVFADGVKCFNCDPDGIVHGHLLDAAQMAHGLFHLGRGEAGPGAYPEKCECGFPLPENINPEKVVKVLANSIVQQR